MESFLFRCGGQQLLFFGFLAFLPFSNNRRRTVDEDTCTPLLTKSLFNSLLIFREFILLLRKRVKSSLLVVFLFLPHLPFLWNLAFFTCKFERGMQRIQIN